MATKKSTVKKPTKAKATRTKPKPVKPEKPADVDPADLLSGPGVGYSETVKAGPDDLATPADRDRKAAGSGEPAKPKKPAKPEKSAKPEKPTKPGLSEPIGFDPELLPSVLRMVNSRLSESGSIWAMTEPELSMIAASSTAMLDKYLPAGGEYSTEFAFIMSVGMYIGSRLAARADERRRVRDLVDDQMPDKPDPGQGTPTGGPRADSRLDQFK